MQRRWLKVPLDDGPRSTSSEGGQQVFEAVALDLALPPTGHDPLRPVLLLLSGLTGSSDEHYIQDILREATQKR
jgi:predicted alpha/beta-fold hydrolase